MYPKRLMSNVSWGFFGGKYNSLEKFIQKVSDYNKDCNKIWFPEKTVLNCQNVTVQYAYWNDEEKDVIEVEFDLVSDNESGFTAGELLFKLHNSVVDKLEEEDYHFFEGLTLWKKDNHRIPNTPIYFINQGAL